MVIRHIFRTCARWRSFMHIYFRYGFDLVFIVYIFMVHWKNKCTKMCHNCRKRIHKWHKAKTKYNQMFMIIEIIEELFGWRTFIHRGYIIYIKYLDVLSSEIIVKNLYIIYNMKRARPWMLANLKIIWQFHAHPVHQKVLRFFGPRYIGDDFF